MNANEQLSHIPSTDIARVAARRDDFQLKKWGDAGKAGFQIVPNVIFRGQKHLGLDCMDIVILLNLTLHWWKVDDLPFPSPTILANRIGVSKRTVERRIKSLEKRKFVLRLPPTAGGGLPRRRYVLAGFVKRLEDLAEVGLNQRKFVQEQRRREEQGYEADDEESDKN